MKKSLTLVAVTFVAAFALLLTPSGRSFARSLGTWEYPVLNLVSGQSLTNAGTLAQSGAATFTGAVSLAGATVTPGSQLAVIPSAQTLGAAGQIAADACGGLKQITSAGVVSSSTTTPLPAAAAGNAGCLMDIVNTSIYAITVKYVANSYNWAGAADVVLGSSDTMRVGSNGSQWFQIGATGNN